VEVILNIKVRTQCIKKKTKYLIVNGGAAGEALVLIDSAVMVFFRTVVPIVRSWAFLIGIAVLLHLEAVLSRKAVNACYGVNTILGQPKRSTFAMSMRLELLWKLSRRIHDRIT
jgi:hypothetical protein